MLETEVEGHEIQPDGLKFFEDLLGHEVGPGVYQKLHLADLLVELLHEMAHKEQQLCLYICFA